MEIKHSIVYGLIKISFICLLFFAMSCQKNDRAKVESLVKEWNNKEIRFPDNPVFTRFVTDTVPYRIPKTDYKVVVFVDSVGCISCKLQLPKWKDLCMRWIRLVMVLFRLYSFSSQRMYVNCEIF